MKKILLLRHGETIWNSYSKTQGSKNIPLSQKGIEEVHNVREELKKRKYNIDKIYSSDLDRCYYTAKIINHNIQKDIEIVKDLREMNFGEWEGLTIQEIEKNFLEHYKVWRDKPWDAVIPGGEDLRSVQSRCLNAINRIIKSYREGTVLIVSHGIAIKTIILGILGIDLYHFYNITIKNTSISEIEIRDYGAVLTLLNDTSHLC